MENDDKVLKIPELLPGTSFHVQENIKENPVKFDNLDEMIYFIRAHTGLEYESIKLILEQIYQELKNKILQGEQFDFGRLGRFTKTSRNKKSTNFKLKKYLLKGMKIKNLMNTATIEEKDIETASYEALVNYVAIYRNFKFGRKIALKCMYELDRRRSLGNTENFEKDIEKFYYLIKTIGKGFIVRINKNFDLNESFQRINKITPAFIFNKEKYLIHVGIIEKDTIDKICSLEESEEFDNDKNFIERMNYEIRF